ncbi:hypothetical protein P692DRAFT_20841535 [Suillus brevipes Sb2]|nr:hypothetical protein P692DRAFT_20841535 [Suillus brevipes Sb2]
MRRTVPLLGRLWSLLPCLCLKLKHQVCRPVLRNMSHKIWVNQIKRAKTTSGGMRNDPSFRPVLAEYGLHNGKFVCTKDGVVLYPESYLKHLRTRIHL